MTDELETIILTAGTAYSEGRYHEALECYEQAIALRPENAILFANYAAILLRLDRVDEALKNADHAIELDPKWAKAYYRRGEALRRLHAFLPAVVSLSEGVALDPSNNLIADLLVDVSQQFFKQFPLDRLRGVGLDRDRFIVLTVTGQELAAAGHHREALTVLSRALSLRTPSLRLRESALSSLASVHFMLSEFAQATVRYEQQLQIRLQLGGPPAEVHDNVAMSAEAAGNYALALSHRKEKAKCLNGVSLAEERLRIARLYGQLNQHEEALELYGKIEESLELMDEGTKEKIANQIRVGRGLIHSLTGETNKCLEKLSGVRASSEDDAIAIADSVVACHLREGNMEEAVEYLNQVLETASELKQEKLFGHACFLLAREQIRNGHHTSAIRLAKRILRLARTTDDRALKRSGLQLLATIYEEQQDVKSSCTLLRKLLEVPGATVLDLVNTLLRLATLAPEIGEDPLKYLTEALEQAGMSRNLDIIALAQSAMLRYLGSSAAEDKEYRLDELLSLQRELLREDINVASRSIIYEDLAMCDAGESSSSSELRALEQSLTEAQEGNNIRRELFLLEKLGDSCLFASSYAEAEGFYQQMLALARQLREVAQIKRGFMKLAM
ncbi:tetratricopeptide repeat protein [Oesophagostomum dentatum]|uniref:Tetratricopeptide repeat protein n=1 Tax=Oesophagostomum dentatum TaxID=61180 RepID=A0A0B1T637_OESDE|nr:tetratricopeptide repeat protein [Oesophagostomum dentatum]